MTDAKQQPNRSDYTKLIEADAAKIRNALERLRGIGLAAGNSALTQGTIALAALASLEAEHDRLIAQNERLAGIAEVSDDGQAAMDRLREALERVAQHVKHYPHQPLDKACRDAVRTALAEQHPKTEEP